MKNNSKYIIFFTAFLFAIVISYVKAELYTQDFFIFLFSSFVIISFFSSAFYFFDPTVKFKDVSGPAAAYDETGISLFQQLSFLAFEGKKRILFAIVLQAILTGVVVYFL